MTTREADFVFLATRSALHFAETARGTCQRGTREYLLAEVAAEQAARALSAAEALVVLAYTGLSDAECTARSDASAREYSRRLTETEDCPACGLVGMRRMAHDPSRIATHCVPGTESECSASRQHVSER